MTFGEKLQSLRRSAGMSQDALAEKLEVSRQAVSKWERDEAMPETEKVVRIAKLFDVSLDELLLGRAPKPEPQPQYQQSFYQPYTPPAPPSGARLEKFLRRHGYKFGYVMMAAGTLICIFAILMRLIWPGLGEDFLGINMPGSLGAGEWQIIEIEGDFSESEKQEITEQLIGNGGFGSSVMGQMGGMMSNALNAQANLFLIGLLPGLALLIGGIIIVVKGKRLAAQEC